MCPEDWQVKRPFPINADGLCRLQTQVIKHTRINGLFKKWVKRSNQQKNTRIGLHAINGLKLHEEPYTDPYVRFCGQTEASLPPLTRWP